MKSVYTFAHLAALALVTCFIAMAISGSAHAVVANVDIEGGTADTTHSGADGILSTTGTVWNGVPAGVDTPGLRDEFGSPTPFGIRFSQPGDVFGMLDPASTNNLQDSGIQVSGLQIIGLIAGQMYDVSAYIGPNAGIVLIDGAGNSGFLGPGAPTYALPGTEVIGGTDGDYVLFSNVVPADLGGGDFGVTIDMDGLLAGIQVEGPVPEPASVVLCAIGGLTLIGVSFGRRCNRYCGG